MSRTYTITLDDETEKFLDLYLTLRPLRPEHSRDEYPGLIAQNFIGSMRKRESEFREQYKERFGKEWA